MEKKIHKSFWKLERMGDAVARLLADQQVINFLHAARGFQAALRRH